MTTEATKEKIMSIVKTFKGKTAGGILKTAKVCEMRAGNHEVVVSHPHECVATIGIRGNGWGGSVYDVLVLTDANGVVARLEMSDKALAIMESLESECDAMYDAAGRK